MNIAVLAANANDVVADNGSMASVRCRCGLGPNGFAKMHRWNLLAGRAGEGRFRRLRGGVILCLSVRAVIFR